MVRAAVLRYDRTDRKDVTHAEMDLSVPLSEGDSLYVEHLALPYTIAHRVEETDSLDVYVLPGSRQQVVIASIEGTQRRIAFYNALMSLIGFVIAAVGVFYWNRSTGGAKDSPLTEGNMGASKMRVRPREDAE